MGPLTIIFIEHLGCTVYQKSCKMFSAYTDSNFCCLTVVGIDNDLEKTRQKFSMQSNVFSNVWNYMQHEALTIDFANITKPLEV